MDGNKFERVVVGDGERVMDGCKYVRVYGGRRMGYGTEGRMLVNEEKLCESGGMAGRQWVGRIN